MAGITFIAFIFRTPLGLWIERRKNLRVRRGDTEVMLEDNYPDEHQPTSASDSAEAKPASQDRHEPDSATGEAGESALGSLLTALEQGDSSNAEQVFDRLQDETRDETKQLENRAMYLALRYYKLREVSALDSLRRMAAEGEAASIAHNWIGWCHERNDNLEQAQNSYRQALNGAKTDEDRARFAIDLARVYSQEDRLEQAWSALTSQLEALGEDSAKSKLFEKLAEVAQSREDRLLEAILLAKVSELRPTDSVARFNAAYAYSHAKMPDLAASFYEGILKTDTNDDMARNNLALAYEELSLISFAGESLVKACENGTNTLASANLAYRYMEIGLFPEAERILKEAIAREQPHQNVAGAIAEMERRRQADSQNRDRILRLARKRSSFLKKVANAATFGPGAQPKIGTDWSTEGFQVEDVALDERRFTVELAGSSDRYRVILNFTGLLGRGSVYKWARDLFDSTRGSFSDPKKAVALLDESGALLEIACVEGDRDFHVVLEQS